jgi:hypothetical protein
LTNQQVSVCCSLLQTLFVACLNETVHVRINDLTDTDVCITNLLHNFIFAVFASTCFGLESQLRDFSTYTAYLAAYIYVSGRVYTSVNLWLNHNVRTLLINKWITNSMEQSPY